MSFSGPPPPPNSNFIFPDRVIGTSSSSSKHPAINLKGVKGLKKEHGLDPKGWCPEKKGQEYFTVSFSKPCEISEIHIMESYFPGSVVKISAKELKSKDWTVLWKNIEGPQVLKTPRIFCPLLSIPKKGFKAQEIRVDMDCRRDCDIPQILGIGIKEMDKIEDLHSKTFQVFFPDFHIVQNDQKFGLNKIVLSEKR